MPQISGQGGLASIVILTFNQLEYTRQCVDSVLQHTREPFELIFVDNASSDGTLDYLRTIEGARVVANDENLGFAAGCNQGLAIAQGDVIVLLNNDAVVTAGWLEGLTAPFAREPQIGITGPRSNKVAGPQLVEEVPYADVPAMHAFARGWSAELVGTGRFTPSIVGFCMAIRREVVAEIGGLDPRFGSGNFEDSDYCLRATLANWRCWIADDVFIHHFGHQSFIGAGIDYQASMNRNLRIFGQKWDIPVEEGSRSLPVGLVLHRRGFLKALDYVELPDEVEYLEISEPMAAYFQGTALIQAGRPREAIGALQRAANLAPRVADIHSALALAYTQSGFHRDAQTALKRVSELTSVNQSNAA